MRTSLLSALLLVGCGKPHVKINAPPPNLTPAARELAFEELRPIGTGVEITTTCNRGCTTSTTQLLMLKSGHEIRYAEDLLPVLPAESKAAAAARDVASARHKRKLVGTIGGLMFGGCFIASAAGFANENDPVMIAGLACAVTGLAIFGGSAVIYGGEINDKTRFVFDNYEQNLATRFNVCVNGTSVVACEDSVPGQEPTTPDPALRSLRQK